MARVATADGCTLHAEAHGEGPPIVFSCALATTSENWRPQVAPLVEAGMRVVLWDFRGHGRSDAPDDPALYDVHRVVEDLARVLSGQVPVERVIEERRERGGLPERVVPAVATEIEVDNDVSAEFSVVDVFTQDRPGVLYAITKTLAALQLDIYLSKVATEAARVADVFYVREASGGGKLSPSRIDEVKGALNRSIAAIR